ncbi:Eco47II family restriction endonuclease [Snuella sedimenti]|uniref:Eco47II family restriction endonuclease n=1 Tax=Snuella sedimenti TaxID=2798802 RepID=A0A8J7J202_9FLAO|nr:Eco47II family restriction endonuclease [Snuella sedimenti]MBJ6367619.1 Eco47II family restriction endonuclease [Snuella sedimenti]
MNNSNQSENKYVSFVSDVHLLQCIENLYNAYMRAKSNFTKKKFYANKVDTIKLIFDSSFNNLSEEELIKLEISRQIDKSVNNAIGTFHEQILGGINGYENGIMDGFDIKANDNTLFADIKNKHNTMNSSSAESLFQKLARYANDYKEAQCYWVQILATKSFNEKWFSIINGKEYSHSRVYKISGDQFYALLTGNKKAFYELYNALPLAINDFLKTVKEESEQTNFLTTELKDSAKNNKRTILDEITFDNYFYYSGFSKI